MHSFLQRLNLKSIFLVFCLLVLPSVFAPYHADDYFQLLLLSGDNSLSRGDDGSLWGLFSFIDSEPVHRLQMQQLGVLPWFAAEDFYFRFWRPLAELTHWLDYRLFGINPMPAHIQSIAWFILLSGIFYRLAKHTLAQRKMLPILALAIFVWDGQHVATIGWIANRNALIAAVFSMLAVYGHMVWRDTGRQPIFFGVLLSFILALGSGESSLAAWSFLFFYAVFLDKDGYRQGFIHLLPYAVITAIWIYCYHSSGFGVNTSGGLYLNPWVEPLAVVKAIVLRLPVYFTAAVLPVPAGLSWIGGETYAWIAPLFYIGALVVMSLFFLLFKGLLGSDRVLKYWLFSSLFALFPVCVTLAQDRLALYQTIGMDMVLAIIIGKYLIYPDVLVSTANKKIARFLVGVHLVLSPLHLLAGSMYISVGAEAIKANALSFNDKTLEESNVLVLQLPIGEAVSLMGIRKVMGRSVPDHFMWIGNDEGPMSITMLDSHNLLVEKPYGFGSGFESAFRSVKERPFRVGQKIPASIGEVEILHINSKNYPDKIRLAVKINPDKKLVLYTYKNGHYQEIALPVNRKPVQL